MRRFFGYLIYYWRVLTRRLSAQPPVGPPIQQPPVAPQQPPPQKWSGLKRAGLWIAPVAMGIVYLVAGYYTIDWWWTPMVKTAALGVAGFTTFLILLPFIPGGIDLLVNKPNRHRPKDPEEANKLLYKKSEFGFYTYLQPGREKIRERGNRFMDTIVRFPGWMRKGERSDNELTPRDPNYWEMTKTEKPYHDSHPLPFSGSKWFGFRWWRWVLYSPVSTLWWFHKHWVYLTTGAVFTGVWPLQKIRVYPMERFKKETNENTGEVSLKKVRDWSDHYRVADFQYPVKMPSVHTQDKLPVTITVNTVVRVFNSYCTAYFTDDDWSSRLLAAISGAITRFARRHPLTKVLTAEEKDVDALAKEIVDIGKWEIPERKTAWEYTGVASRFGIWVTEIPQLIDITPTNPDDDKLLGDVARAKVDKEAAKERAKGNAASIVEAGKALKTYPEAAVIPQVEGMVRATKEAGDKAIVILGGGRTLDPGEAALLREVRKLQPPQPPATGGKP